MPIPQQLPKTNKTIHNVAFDEMLTQRVKLDALRMSSAVADENGMVPLYEGTLIGYFQAFLSLVEVNDDEDNIEKLKVRLRKSKDPRQDFTRIISEQKWDRDWESVVEAFRVAYTDESPEVAENAANFQAEPNGSSTQTESLSESESTVS